jgi:ABC-2 type transport system permease protein
MASRILALIVKELLAVLRDPRSRIVLIGPPLIQLFVFSFAATLEVKNVEIGVLNQDVGRGGWEIVQRVAASPTFTRVDTLRGVEEIKAYIDGRHGLLVLHIPQDFSRRVLRGEEGKIQVILDGRRSNAAQIVQGYLERMVSELSAEYVAANGLEPPASELITRHWFNPNLSYIWFTVPALVGILTMLIGLIVTALSVARERELGTFDQLLVSPLQPWEILVGKTVPAMLIGAAEGTVILLAAIFVFRVPLNGNVALLYLAMLAFLAAIVGVGLFISALSSTQQQALLGAFTFMVPATLLSGFATPIHNMPDWLQLVTLGNPLRWFLVVIRGVFMKGLPTDLVLANTWPMVAIAIVTLTGAALLFRRRLE